MRLTIILLMLFTAGLSMAGQKDEKKFDESSMTYTTNTLVDINHDGTAELIYYQAKSAGKDFDPEMKFNELFVGFLSNCDILLSRGHAHRIYQDRVYCGKFLMSSYLGIPYLPKFGGRIGLNTITVMKGNLSVTMPYVQAVDGQGNGKKFILNLDRKNGKVDYTASNFKAAAAVPVMVAKHR